MSDAQYNELLRRLKVIEANQPPFGLWLLFASTTVVGVCLLVAVLVR